MGSNQQRNQRDPYLSRESQGAAQGALWGSLPILTANKRTESLGAPTQNSEAPLVKLHLIATPPKCIDIFLAEVFLFTKTYCRRKERGRFHLFDTS